MPITWDDIEPMLRTLPAAPSEWHVAWNDLMQQNEWLQQKLDLKRRAHELVEYARRWLPELAKRPPGVVIDVGPGMCEILRIGRLFGHRVLGIDAPSGEGGMGHDYLKATRLMAERCGVPVLNCGLEKFVELAIKVGSVDPLGRPSSPSIDPKDEPLAILAAQALHRTIVINMRGSIEQCFARLMEGPPHHETMRADQLRWADPDGMYEVFARMFVVYSRLLRPDGVVCIHANGSADKESHNLYLDTLFKTAKEAGLELVDSDGDRLHKFAVA